MRRKSLTALAAARLLPCALALQPAHAELAAQPAHAEELYVIEQLVVGLNNSPDETGERIGSVRSGDKLEVIERQGDEVHVRTAAGREGWVRSGYLTAEEPLKVRLAERTAELARLKEDMGRLTAQLEAARVSAGRAAGASPASGASPAPGAQAALSAASSAAGVSAAEPPEEAVRTPSGGLFGNGSDASARRLWPWALGSALAGLVAGFALGILVLDRRIRRKYGGLRIY